MGFKARIKDRSATGSKIDLAIIVGGVEHWERIQVDDLIDRESNSLESKMRLAKLELLKHLKQKKTRRLTPQDCSDFGEKELEL